MKEASNAEHDTILVGAPSRQGGSACGRPQATPLHQSLWLWVLAGFLFLGMLWTGMFLASRQADSLDVPLAKQGGRP